MNTAPSPDARFWDRLAPKYSKKPVANEDAYQKTLERARSYLKPGAHVLELGCGTGTTALKLAPHVGQLLATDLSREMIAIAREKARAQGAGNVRFATGTLDAESLQPGSFDAVMAFNLMHLLPDVPAAIRRVHALLRPGGLWISKTPCLGDDSVLLRVVIPILRAFGKAPYVNYLKKGQLQTDVADGGLQLLETSLLPQKSHSLFIVAQKADG